MFIFNYSDVDLQVRKLGHRQTLPANQLVYVDEKWVSLEELKQMFGNYIEEADSDTAIEEFYFDDQVVPEMNTLYFTETAGTGVPRVFVKGGSIKILCTDAKAVPTSKADLVPCVATEVTDLLIFTSLTKYMLFEVASGTPEVVLSNVKIVKSKALTDDTP